MPTLGTPRALKKPPQLADDRTTSRRQSAAPTSPPPRVVDGRRVGDHVPCRPQTPAGRTHIRRNRRRDPRQPLVALHLDSGASHRQTASNGPRGMGRVGSRRGKNVSPTKRIAFWTSFGFSNQAPSPRNERGRPSFPVALTPTPCSILLSSRISQFLYCGVPAVRQSPVRFAPYASCPAHPRHPFSQTPLAIPSYLPSPPSTAACHLVDPHPADPSPHFPNFRCFSAQINSKCVYARFDFPSSWHLTDVRLNEIPSLPWAHQSPSTIDFPFGFHAFCLSFHVVVNTVQHIHSCPFGSVVFVELFPCSFTFPSCQSRPEPTSSHLTSTTARLRPIFRGTLMWSCRPMGPQLAHNSGAPGTEDAVSAELVLSFHAL